MPFLLDSDAQTSEITESINYLLGNFVANLSADPNSGEISGPSGVIVAYLYRYMAVRYADSADGSVNFSDTPTNREYFGIRNTGGTSESLNPADYIWSKVDGGFGTTKFLFYQCNGGRQINFFAGTSAPDESYIQESGAIIDLDIVTTVTAYNTAAPTIYLWTTTDAPPARPTTTSLYTWATGNYGAPSGWTTSPAVNTTPGSYLWAITIRLVENTNVTLSLLDWTNAIYPIYVVSYNGEDGDPGDAGLSAITCYLVQSQAGVAPATPANTIGPTAPPGWSLTAPAVTVGQVLWYSFGRYNESGVTLGGVPAGETSWGTPTAASVFQDIRSDNWNGSNPPVAGTISTHGTAGYYIQRSTGDMYLNSVYGRGIARFDGQNIGIGGASAAIIANESLDQSTGIEALTDNTFALSGAVKAYNQSSGDGNAIYASHSGTGRAILAFSQNGIGVQGGGVTGVFGNGTVGVRGIGGGPGGVGVKAEDSGGATASLEVVGIMQTNNSTRVANLNAQFAETLIGTTSNQLRFVSGTSTGASLATFSGTKPGGASTNVWITMQIDNQTIYIPVWA